MRKLEIGLIAAMVMLLGCNSGSSPTQPPLAAAPQQPPPPPAVITSALEYRIQIFDPLGGSPGEVELSLDGAPLFAGQLDNVWGDSMFLPTEMAGALEPLANGRHRFEIKIVRRLSSPTAFQVSGRLDVVERENGRPIASRALLAWDVPVTLTKHESWIGVFDYRDGAARWIR